MNYTMGGKIEFDAVEHSWEGDRFAACDTVGGGWGVHDYATATLLNGPDGQLLEFLPVQLPAPPEVSGPDNDIEVNGETLARTVAFYVAGLLNEAWDQQSANHLAEAEAGVIDAARNAWEVYETIRAHGETFPLGIPTAMRQLNKRLQTYDTLRGKANS